MKNSIKRKFSIILTLLFVFSTFQIVFADIGYNRNKIDNYVGVCVANKDVWYQKNANTAYNPYVKRYNSNRQCVGYVYARLEDKLSLSPDFSSGAGAKDIPSNAPNGATRTSYTTGKKYTIEVYKNDNGSHITGNSWVSFGATSNNKYGHVVYVEEVVGNYVYYTEGGGGYGLVGVGSAGKLKKATKSNFLNKTGGYVGTVVFRSNGNNSTTTKCTSHSYNDRGYCSKCGLEYSISLTTMSGTTYQTTKDNVPVRRRPYSPEKITKYLSKGTRVTVIASGKNSVGNLWYMLNDGSWIYSGNLTKAASQTVASSTLNINLTQYPTSTTKGKSFGLRGTVSSNYKITSVRGYIINSSGTTVQSTIDTPNSSSMDIRYASVNQNLLFNKLSRGTYTLKIVASDSSGASRTWSKSFTVK